MRWRWIQAIASGLLAIAALVSCGGAGSEQSETAGEQGSSSVVEGRRCTVGGSIEFDTVIGWSVTGPPGTVFTTDEDLTNSGSVMGQGGTYTLADGPREWLYTGFVTEVEVEFTIDSGGPADVTIFYGHLADDGEFGTIEITEELETISLEAGASTTLRAIDPCP